jgi:hypothetical protein
MRFLRQSTAVDLPLGPFVDAADGFTAEDGLTISQADVRLKKNAGAWAQINESTAASHEENGWYEKAFNATDTNTVGHLVVAVHEAGARPVVNEFTVLEEAVYDALYTSGAIGFGALYYGLIDNADTSLIDLGTLGLADDELNDHLISVLDVSTGRRHLRFVDDYDGTNSQALLNADLPITTESGVDTYVVYATRRDPQVGEIADEIGSVTLSGLDSTVAACLVDLRTRTGYSIYATGTADAGSSQVLLVDAARTESTSAPFKNCRVVMTSGTAGNLNQSRPIYTFSASTDTITLQESFPSSIAAGDGYAILSDTAADVQMWQHALVAESVNGMLPCVDAVMTAGGVVLHSTAESGSETSLVDSALSGDGDDYWNDAEVYFTSGTLAGKQALVTDYESATGTFTLAPELPDAIATHTYILLKGGLKKSSVTHWRNSSISENLMDAAGVRTAIGMDGGASFDERTQDPETVITLDAMFGDPVTVDDSTFSPTTTAFETSRTVDAAALYSEQAVTFRTGENTGMTVRITGYAFTNSKVKLTVDTLYAAPADGDEFIIAGRIEQ